MNQCSPTVLLHLMTPVESLLPRVLVPLLELLLPRVLVPEDHLLG